MISFSVGLAFLAAGLIKGALGVGLVTGMLTGATGVYVIPTVPYLTSLGLERDELVQAIGIAAFVCPLALGLALALFGPAAAAPAARRGVHARLLRRADTAGQLHFPEDIRMIKALAFDVFGTVVDWRSSLIREGELLGARKGLKLDWGAFADGWRAGYRPAMDRVMRGDSGWANIDRLHREILDALLARFSIDGLNESEKEDLNRAWHRLMPWPDAVPGLNRLRSRYVLATLSNGNISLLVDMAKHAGLPWDCVLSGELIGKYKPHPDVYRMAARLLGVATGELMLVAAHPPDLKAAQAAGLKAAYVPRPLEHGPGHPPPPADPSFEVVATDFVDLAAKLGA